MCRNEIIVHKSKQHWNVITNYASVAKRKKNIIAANKSLNQYLLPTTIVMLEFVFQFHHSKKIEISLKILMTNKTPVAHD